MAHLLDTNLLLRWANDHDPERPLALSAVAKLGRQGEVIYTTPQNYIELWTSATRAKTANGLGMTPFEAERLVTQQRMLFPLLSDTGAIFNEWLRIAVTASVSGRQTHDARLVAVMLTYGITHILTFDRRDFNRYQVFGITVVHPADV